MVLLQGRKGFVGNWRLCLYKLYRKKVAFASREVATKGELQRAMTSCIRGFRERALSK